MPTIVLATQNPGKVAELQALLQGTDIDLIGLDELGDSFPEPEETGTTFLENATIKAVAYARLTGLACLADDSGLIVDALDGRPGVISSHYAFDGDANGDAASMTRQERDTLNSKRVLDEMTDIPYEQRSARFTCTMVLAEPDGTLLASSVGEFEGRIGRVDQVPFGDNGFGYDPIFLVAPDFSRTSAQMNPDEKNAISHRAKAVSAMVQRIQSVFKEN